MSESLVMWTIYDHPSDHPGHFVARRWLVGSGNPVRTDTLMASDGLEWLRDQMRDMALVCLTRSDGDDPSIVETWI